jgi:hypothetical protein
MKITEQQLRLVIRKAILAEKKWSDFKAPKNQVIAMVPKDFDSPAPAGIRDLDDEIFDLIQNAYKDVPLSKGKFGNAKVQSPDALPGGYSVMQAADLDDDPDPDFFRGGKMLNGRYKMGIVGHDGSDEAINKYLEETAMQLKSGAIAEMSGKIAHIMITRYEVSSIQTHEEVEDMLGKPVRWIGKHRTPKYAERYGKKHESWYERKIGDDYHMKILLGGE